MDVDANAPRKRLHESTEEEVTNLSCQKTAMDKPKKNAPAKKYKAQQSVSTVSGYNDSVQLTQNSSPKKGTDKANGLNSMGTQARNEKVCYDAFCKAPYIIHFRAVSVNNSESTITLLEISRKLIKINIKFDKLSKYSRDTWVGHFKSKTTANNALQNKYLNEMRLIAFIPGFKLRRKGIIHEIPLDMPMDELKQVIEEENSSVLINNLFRLKRRNKTTNTLEDSLSVCIDFRGETLPEDLTIYRTINRVTPYVPAVRQYFKCGNFGHISKACTKEEICLTCSGQHTNSKDLPYNLTPRCVNCKETHRTLDRNCNQYKKRVEIAKVMAFDNLPYLEAKRIVEKNFMKSKEPPRKTLNNFPPLDACSNASQRILGRDVESPVPTTPTTPYVNVLKRELLSAANLSSVPKEFRKESISIILNRILDSPDAELLVDRIWAFISQYISLQNSLLTQNGP